MTNEISTLRSFIIAEVRSLREEWLAESYDKKLYDDESINSKSVYVPDDIKKSIKKWIKDMMLG
jgi:hypothetical protein